MLGYCRTEQSKLILGSTLSVEIGSNGSYAAADVHADGVVDTQRIYATLIAEALRSQVVRWLLEVNAPLWAATFNQYVPGGCSPEDILAELPVIEWVLSDESPAQRMAIFQGIRTWAMRSTKNRFVPKCRVLAPLSSQPVASDAVAPATPAFTLAIPTAVTPTATSVAAPTIEEANEDEASPSAAEKLAAEMTEHGIDACEHGRRTAADCAASSADAASCRASMASPGWKLEWAAIQKEVPNGSP